MMLDEATTVHVVKGAIYTNGVESSTPRDLERVILSSLSSYAVFLSQTSPFWGAASASQAPNARGCQTKSAPSELG